MSRRVVFIMAGGTGGHVFPALATARVLKRRGFDVVWLGTRRGIEARLVPAEGIPVEWLSVGGVRGKSVSTLLAAPFRLVNAVLQAVAALRRHRPAVVLGAGGFASGPGGIAAWLLRRPLVVHEQNAIAGLTNRVLARLADRVLEGFPGSFGPRVRAERVGNPVRPEIAAVAAPEERYAGREGRARLLRLRRESGLGTPERGRSGRHRGAARDAAPRRASPDRERRSRGNHRCVPQPRPRRRRARLRRRHGGRLWLGRPGAVPRRCAHGRGAGRGGRAGDPRAVSGGRGRSPDPQRRLRGRGGRGGADAGSDAHAAHARGEAARADRGRPAEAARDGPGRAAHRDHRCGRARSRTPASPWREVRHDRTACAASTRSTSSASVAAA